MLLRGAVRRPRGTTGMLCPASGCAGWIWAPRPSTNSDRHCSALWAFFQRPGTRAEHQEQGKLLPVRSAASGVAAESIVRRKEI